MLQDSLSCFVQTIVLNELHAFFFKNNYLLNDVF